MVRVFLSVWLEARARRYFDAFFHEASRFAQGLPRREIMPPALGATGMHSRRTFVHCEHFSFGGAGVRCFEFTVARHRAVDGCPCQLVLAVDRRRARAMAS